MDSALATDAVTSEEIIAALQRVLDSDAFASAPQSRTFLAFVVTETVAGRGERLSERIVGRRAFDRPDNFDGRFDASVRVRAMRVRKALSAYYSSVSDPLQIDLPPGKYTPVFHRTHVVPVPELEPGEVTLAVAVQGDDGLADAGAQEMVRRLSSFPGLHVVGPIPLPNGGTEALPSRLGVRFLLDVSVTDADEDSSLHLSVLDGVSGATIWRTRLRLGNNDPSTLDLDQWATGIAGQLGDYTGTLLIRTSESLGQGTPAWQAMQSYYRLYSTDKRSAVIDTVEQLARASQEHRNPVILAALAHTLSLRAGYGFSDDIQADRDAAVALANEALTSDPESATAHLALTTVALTGHDPATARHHAAKAADLAPHHPSIVGTAGNLLAYAGDWDGGIAAIRRALHLNPHMPGYTRILLVLDHIFAGNDALALAEAALIDTPNEAWGPYYRAMALMGLGYADRARTEMAEAAELDPSVLDGVRPFIAEWVQLSEDQMRILEDRLQRFAGE